MTTVQDEVDVAIDRLLDAVFEKYSYDFRKYSKTSVRRRLTTALTRFEIKDIPLLQEKALKEPAFFISVLQFLTVPTSEMFRDPLFFKAMREEVVSVLKTYPSLKIWIAGCSTGEEVYSYAILLHEEGLLDRTIIYATDINPVSLKKAEEGVFAMDRVKDFTLNYQKSGGLHSFSDYYTSSATSILMDKSLRRNVVFADHSLATDSVFSEMQLVSCRNVLIYFNRELQDRALGLFFESLSHRGFLGLGSKESLRFSDYDQKFSPFIPAQKIYRRR